MNVWTFSGNLGKDCRTKMVGDSFVANFSVAVTEGYGEKKKTHWVDCAYWGKGAQAVAQYLVKGQAVIVSGEGGMKEASGDFSAQPTCRVNSLSLAGGKREDKPAAKEAPKPQPQAGSPAADFDDSDIPFN
jgi:single-strand DNA-binding protein